MLGLSQRLTLRRTTGKCLGRKLRSVGHATPTVAMCAVMGTGTSYRSFTATTLPLFGASQCGGLHRTRSLWEDKKPTTSPDENDAGAKLTTDVTADSGESEHAHGAGDEEGFKEDIVVVKDDKGNSLIRLRRQPLSLIEEVPLPQRVLTDIELVMMAWCEEHARQYGMILMALRIGIFVLVFIILYVFYITQLSSERVMRGVDKVPSDLRIGSVVYFDVSEDGVDIGRVVIGLFNEDCPLYCEYFHRRCTGNGGNGDSFRGMKLAALVPRHCLIFGDGREMTHDVTGFDPHFLPTEKLSGGSWRGCLSAIAYGNDRESPNFAIHSSSGDYRPQVFGMVIGGYNVIERIDHTGSSHGNAPKREFIIEECGELCTLAKSHIVAMPWKLYETVSRGYDEEKFGARADPELLRKSDERGELAYRKAHHTDDSTHKTKRWWFF